MTAPIPNILSWPLDGIDEQGRWRYATDDASVREVIRNILLTRPGERLLRPRFGAGFQDFIHQPNNETTRTLMANVVRKAIEHWETRIQVSSVDVVREETSLSRVQITIRYRMRHAPDTQQLVMGIDLNQL
jgi:uncharacterized protein